MPSTEIMKKHATLHLIVTLLSFSFSGRTMFHYQLYTKKYWNLTTNRDFFHSNWPWKDVKQIIVFDSHTMQESGFRQTYAEHCIPAKSNKNKFLIKEIDPIYFLFLLKICAAFLKKKDRKVPCIYLSIYLSWFGRSLSLSVIFL